MKLATHVGCDIRSAMHEVRIFVRCVISFDADCNELHFIALTE